MEAKCPNSNGSNTPVTNSVDNGEAKDVVQFVSDRLSDQLSLTIVVFQVQTLLQSVQDKFQQMSDQILSRIDEMGHRIDDLEHNLNELVAQSELNEENASSNPMINSNAQQINK